MKCNNWRKKKIPRSSCSLAWFSPPISFSFLCNGCDLTHQAADVKMFPLDDGYKHFFGRTFCCLCAVVAAGGSHSEYLMRVLCYCPAAVQMWESSGEHSGVCCFFLFFCQSIFSHAVSNFSMISSRVKRRVEARDRKIMRLTCPEDEDCWSSVHPWTVAENRIGSVETDPAAVELILIAFADSESVSCQSQSTCSRTAEINRFLINNCFAW